MKKIKEYMEWDSIEIEVNLKLGNDAFKCYTCDLHMIILILTQNIEIKL